MSRCRHPGRPGRAIGPLSRRHGLVSRARAAWCAGLLVVSVALGTCSGCAHLIFWPEAEHVLTPDRLDVEYEDVWFSAADGTRLHGWYMGADGSRGTVLHLHGNAENISTHHLDVTWLTRHGWDVFAFDYRGYGWSEGRPSVGGVHQDAHAAYRYLLAERGARPETTVVFGQSLGASVAIVTFARVEPRLAAVIAEAGFVGYRDVAREMLAGSWLTWPLKYPMAWTIPGDHRAIDHVARLSPVPVLLMHSRADQVIPGWHSQRVYEAAREPKTLWLVDGARHGDILDSGEMRERVLQWLDERVVTGKAK